MRRARVLLDANILYPAPLRDLFLQLSADGVIAARWSNDIHREWIGALLRNEPHRDPAALSRTRDLMDRSTPEALVTGYELIVADLDLPDPDDRHVLAAAIVGRCRVIVTRNLAHFPNAALTPHHIAARHPDGVVCRLLVRAPERVFAAVRTVRTRLRRPPIEIDDYLAILMRQGLTTAAARLAPFKDQL